jgi:ParB-like chromosome segregation protein Spo0J
LEFHEVANVFPLMEGDEFRELVRDIEKNGQQQPILTYEGKILDGRNRYRACMEADVEPWVEKWSGGSPVEAVLSLNLHRRHLSKGERSMIASRMLPHLEAEARERMLRGKAANPTERMPEGPTPKRVQGEAREEAARLTGTNPRYVSDAKRLAREAPEMAERVERGEVTIPQAKRTLGWEKPKDEEHEPLKGEDRRPVKEVLGTPGEDFELPPWDLPRERKEYANVVKNLVRLSKLDPEAVASHCKGEYEAERDIEHVRALQDWFGRYEAALEKRRRELQPGNLRAVR